MKALELWGGHECTVNSVGERLFDQTRIGGHHLRDDDLDRFAALGLKTLRYPVLWERVSPDRPDEADWSWTDARLARLRSLGIAPIVGLIHHGSGPAYTSLIADDFAEGLAAHAAAAAERYPWVRDWTPVNEPLTTARFAALYGIWRPHARDERLFWLALLNQVDATRLSMRAIRARNPQARLIQTEDIGRAYATAPLADQARFDNQRRWMSFDLLAGRVTPGHWFWERLTGFGFEDRLRAIADDPCPPDVVGVNHYLTSDRFLDHRLERYPERLHGGNYHQAFADAEAIRVLQPPPEGLAGALEAAWDRYGIPVAVTECQNGCTREEQMRWLAEAWSAAQSLRARGVAVEAVTAWALLGSHNWNLLLTSDKGEYEPGAFDSRAPAPRRTALADVVEAITADRPLPDVALQAGWWRRDIRLQHAPHFRSAETPEPAPERRSVSVAPRPILITGATGTLGKALARTCAWRGLDYVLTSRRDLALDDAGSIRAALERFDPWLVINAAGYVRVDEAETDVAGCMAGNATGAVALAEACRDRDAAFVTFSSDLVFDGQAARAYVEGDRAAPLNVYGRSKAAAEAGVLGLWGKALVVRTSAFFSPYDPHNFACHVRRTLEAGQPFDAADDLIISPTYVPHLCDAVLDLALDGEVGLWHLANAGEVSWSDFARCLADSLSLDASLVRGRPAETFHWAARRPARVPLASERGWIMPKLETAIARYAEMALA